MATKKKRLAGRAAKKNRKGAAAKKGSPKSRSSATRRRAIGRQSTRRKQQRTAVRTKERKVEDARRPLIEVEKELAVEELPKRDHPATKKRGADPHVPSRIKRKHLSNAKEQKLEQGLEESMAGSDPVSVTQPATPIAEDPDEGAPREDS